MAGLALGLVGGLLFGPVGFLVGSFLGNLLDPPKQQGPRLSSLKLQVSQYGDMVKKVWGTVRIAGNVIWQTDLTEHQQGGGKGGPQVTTYTYSASFAIGLCEGPIVGIARVWADSRLIYDRDTGLGTPPWTIYLGTETQGADPEMTAVLGAGNVPGYRGTAYVVYKDWDLTQFFNRIPNLEFEVETVGVADGQITPYRITVDNTAGHHIALPLAVQWPLDVGQVRITGWTSGAVPADGANISENVAPTGVYTYSAGNPLAFQGAGVITPPGDNWPQGIYLYGYTRLVGLAMLYDVNGVLQPYWTSLIPAPTGTIGDSTQTSNPFVLGIDMDLTTTTPQGINNLAAWGLPPTEYYAGAVGTSDCKSLFVFTAPSSGGNATKWYRVSLGAVIAQGTVSSPFSDSAAGFGWNRATFGGFSGAASCFENNGQYAWTFAPQVNGLFPPPAAISVYKIDSSGNLDYDATAGIAEIDPGNVNGISMGAAFTVFSPATGYCGFATDNALCIFQRIVIGSGDVTLAQIVSDISVMAGLTTGQIDVSQLTDVVAGYVLDKQMSARNMLQPLRNAYFFDAVESDGVVKFPKRTNVPVVTITLTDLGAMESGTGTPPAPLQGDRTQEVDLPYQITVNYMNQGADYQPGSQMAQRMVTNSQAQTSLDIPVVLQDVAAKAIAYALLQTAWAEREKYTFYTSRQYAYLDPTDVIAAQGRIMRIITREETDTRTIKFEALAVAAPVLASPGAGGPAAPAQGFVPPAPGTPLAGTFVATTALLLDTPLVVDTDVQDGFYAAMAPTTAGSWRGASLTKSTDGGSTYATVLTETSEDTFGTVTGVPTPWNGGNTFDESSVIGVAVGSGETLSGASAAAVLAGANMALAGSEILQYKNAVLVAPGAYNLSGLLRGRRGTEWAVNVHALGERFVQLPVARVAQVQSEMNLGESFKAVTSGASLANTVALPFVNQGASLAPYAPVLLGGGPDGSGNVGLSWVRRTRIGGQWAPGAEVPLSEASESYVVQIWNAGYSKCARVITGITSPSAVYTAAQQVTDFGATQQTIFFSVGQIGVLGIGTQAQGSAPGAGSSNVDPLAPVAPYASPTSGSSSPPPAANTVNMVVAWPGTNGTIGNVRVFTKNAGAFGCGTIFSFQFTTSSTPVNNVLGYIDCFEFAAPLALRTACVSTVRGDFSGTVLGSYSRAVTMDPFFAFSLGTNTQGALQLSPSTTYYLNVKNDNGLGICSCATGDCAVGCELSKPPGT